MTDYDQGYTDGIKRAWELDGFLQLKYQSDDGDAVREGQVAVLVELAQLLLAAINPPTPPVSG